MFLFFIYFMCSFQRCVRASRLFIIISESNNLRRHLRRLVQCWKPRWGLASQRDPSPHLVRGEVGLGGEVRRGRGIFRVCPWLPAGPLAGARCVAFRFLHCHGPRELDVSLPQKAPFRRTHQQEDDSLGWQG